MPVSINGTNGLVFADGSTQGTASPGRNRIINGAMMIDQRNAGASVTPAGSTYTLDRWVYQPTPASKFSIQRSTVAPTGFSNSLLLTVVSAYTPTTNDSINIGQYIEGFNVADLNWGTANAATATLSFWVRCSVTGTYSVQFGGDNGRGYIGNYTVNAANTWEKKSIVVPGDTSGTYGTTNGTGITVFFALGAGSGRQNTANTWIASGYTTTAGTGTTNLVETNGATLYITGVQLEKSAAASDFDFRSYSQELALCQRYYLKFVGRGAGDFGAVGVGTVASSSQAELIVYLPVEMRTKPTASFGGNLNLGDGGAYPALSSINSNWGGRSAFYFAAGAASASLTIGRGVYLYTQTNSTDFFALSAEL